MTAARRGLIQATDAITPSGAAVATARVGLIATRGVFIRQSDAISAADDGWIPADDILMPGLILTARLPIMLMA